MARFTVNSTRFDPYLGFKFKVKWDGQYVAGLSKMSALKRSTDPVVHRDGADPSHERKSPGKSKYDAVTFERGLTHDAEFERWANLVHALDNPMMRFLGRVNVVVGFAPLKPAEFVVITITQISQLEE